MASETGQENEPHAKGEVILFTVAREKYALRAELNEAVARGNSMLDKYSKELLQRVRAERERDEALHMVMVLSKKLGLTSSAVYSEDAGPEWFDSPLSLESLELIIQEKSNE